MTKPLRSGPLALLLLTTTSACAPSSPALVRTDLLTLPAATSRSAAAAARDLAPTAVTLPRPTPTGNLPEIIRRLQPALDTCNADKARALQDLGLAPPR